jgi:hypothetical protein
MRLLRVVCFLTAVSIVPFVGGGTGDAAGPTIPIYVFAGQSNMVGATAKAAEIPAYSATLTVPKDNILFWGPTADSPRNWLPLEPPTEVWQSVVMSGFGPEISAAHRLSSQWYGRDIAIFKYARNSSSLSSDWHPKNSYGLYDRMITRLNIARKALTAQTGRPTKVAAFYWMQGESDAKTWKQATSYGKNLRSLISAVRRDTGQRSLPVVIGQISNISRWYKRYDHAEMVMWKQYEVARDDPRVYLVKTWDLSRDPLSPAHFDTKGTIDLGIRMAGGK